MQYEYFYGAQAEQFSFYRIPKALFTEPNFRELSTDAKVLYGILLDRMSLSLKNQWLDAQNKVYIIFTVEEIMDALNCANQKATRLMVELEKQAGRSIAAVVEKTPDKARSVDRFARYYLPEVVKLMGTYAALEQNGVRGENAAQIEAELRRNAETTATAFENQLDALYSAEAMDISTDIEVLDSILKSQNLAK